MKKIKWMICLLAIGTSAQAYTQNTGDVATYSASTINSNGEIYSTHNVRLRLDNYDRPSDTYSYSATLTYPDGSTYEFTGLGAGLPDREWLRADCGSRHGTEESIIVGAGTFQTCRFEWGAGKNVTWYGDVPFGIVKEEVQNYSVDETYRSELESFHWANP